MHQAQDTFVHTLNYDCKDGGHVPASIIAWISNEPDVDNNPEEWLKAYKFTKEYVQKFKNKCGCIK
jgi:hypothetical protein